MPELEQKTFQKRQVAYKARISDVLNGTLTKDGFSNNIKLNGIDASRVNIIATLIYKSEEPSFASAVIDDGTSRISLRAFENKNIFSKIDVGDLVLVIGKAREFNNERYLMPEIAKKLNDIAWMEARKAELRNTPIEIRRESDVGPVLDAASVEPEINQQMCMLVRSLDNGNGVSVEEVIKKSGKNEAEKILSKLLENGDIFEVMPGRLKVLE